MLLALSALLLVGVASGCKEDYDNYLQCLKDQYHTQSEVGLALFEREYRKSLESQAEQCGDEFCPLEFRFANETAFRNNGNCFLCDDLGKFIAWKIMVGEKKNRKCANEKIVEITKKEAYTCAKRSLSDDFEFDFFPDFEEKYDANRRVLRELVASTKGFLVVSQQIDKCRKKSSKIAGAVNKCWTEISDLKDRMPRHCGIAAKCLRKVPVECQAEVKNISGTICNCILDKRRGLTQRAKSVIEKLKKKTTNTKQCVAQLTELVKSDSVDWMKEITYTVDTCPLPAKRVMNLPRLLELGCQFAFSAKDWSHLEYGLQLLANYFESMWARYSRFCPCDV